MPLISESALKHKLMENTLGSIRGRQGTVNALISHEHYPRIRRLRIHSSAYENYQNALQLAAKFFRRLGLHEQASKRVPDGLTYNGDDISGYTSSKPQKLKEN